jgi:hypothetical protein
MTKDKEPQFNIDAVRHPDYLLNYYDWVKYRFIQEGGDNFIEEYVKQFSTRESTTDFTARKTITPIAAFSKGAILDVQNAIFQRMADISRSGGSTDYQAIIKGKNGGVDRHGSTMNYFIGQKVLNELLFMGKIGVFVDMPILPMNPALNDVDGKNPYFYLYAAEDIYNWEYDEGIESPTFNLTKLLLRERYYKIDDRFSLPTQLQDRYRYIYFNEDGNVTVRFYNQKGEITDSKGQISTSDYDIVLNLKRIPFALFELNQPLTKDIANHQIALTNLESSDIAYALKANYPFYTEQRSAIQSSHLKDAESTNKGSEIEVGDNVGRAYAAGMDRPQFIHPSPEPLEASMEKQKNLKDDIRTLINLALSNTTSKYASAESKELDSQGLEAGLSAIGLVLEHGESELAELFASYENTDQIATVTYPTRYSLKSDRERLEEVSKLEEQRSKVPSLTAKKEISKKIATLIIGNDVSFEVIQKIHQEIDKADYISGDPEAIASDLEKNLVSLKTASLARGYKAGEVDAAKEDYNDRLKRIAESQSVKTNAGARGLTDLQVDPNEAKDEKKESQNPDLDADAKKNVRGKEE